MSVHGNGRFVDVKCGKNGCGKPPKDHTITGPVSHAFQMPGETK